MLPNQVKSEAFFVKSAIHKHLMTMFSNSTHVGVFTTRNIFNLLHYTKSNIKIFLNLINHLFLVIKFTQAYNFLLKCDIFH